MKLTLTWIKREEKASKAGKPFTSLSIKTTEYGDRYLSGFGNAENRDWKVGDAVEGAEVIEKPVGDKVYLNFEMPKSSKGIDPKIQESLTNISMMIVNNNREINKKLDAIGVMLEKLTGTKARGDGEVVNADAWPGDDGLDDYPINNLGEPKL